MKADLVTREPQRLAAWEQSGLYDRILAARSQAPKFVLHDGPPFANGDVHVGTALRPEMVLNLMMMSLRILFSAVPTCTSPFAKGGPSWSTNLGA